MAKLPNGENAVVDTANKLLGYCLNMNHVGRDGKLSGGNKARVFADVLGITSDHAQLLTDKLLEAAKENDAVLKETAEFLEDNGSTSVVSKYEIRFSITGPNSRTAEIISAWKVTLTDDVPSLVSCRLAKDKSK